MRATQWFAVMVVGAVIGGFGLVDGAQAATCTVADPLTNPDASLTNSNSCGPGVDNNDNQANVRTATGDNDWTLVGSVGSPLYLTFTGTTGGDWFIDASAPDNTDWLIVIKDGTIPEADYAWFWFVVDTSIACANTAYDFCGTWTMYGTGGNIKDISHMSLYSQDGGPPDEVPEPQTLALVGLALLVLALARRRRVR